MTAARTDPEKRSEALAHYQAHGLADTARGLGIPKTTLRRWAQEEGIDTAALAGADAERTTAAVDARNARIKLMRADLREQLLSSAADLLERTNEPHIDYRGKDNQRVEFDRAPADACRSYAVAAAVLIDKFRLESGEATEIVSLADRKTQLAERAREFCKQPRKVKPQAKETSR